jgi:hypothetical protein
MLRHFTTSSTYLQSADHAEAGDQRRPSKSLAWAREHIHPIFLLFLSSPGIQPKELTCP